MNRPRTLVAVAGTATEVGKTFVAAALATELRRRGLTVAARKPAQSFAPDADEPTDAEVLAAATGEAADAVCPPHRTYEVPMAPPMAADVLGRPAPSLADLVEITWPSGVDVGLVESVGGVRSPVAADGDSRDLIRATTPDLVVVVADAGLGTIDAVRLATDALAPLPMVVMLNRFDPADDLHRRNLDWLVTRDGLDCVTGADPLVDRLAT